ncbi:MAG: hypothetical protein U1C74_31105, partial [Phenylobacterium sp.]|nr:hypothetical protein [Phenylobacterium sp.]
SPDEMAERRFRFEVIAEGVFDTALHEGLDRAEARDHAERFRAEAHDWIEAPDFLREDLRRQLGRAYRLAARPRNGGARHGGPRPASTEPPRADPDKPRPRTPSPQAAPRNAGRLGPPDPRPTPAPPRLRLIPRVPDTNVRARQRRFEPPRHQGRQAVRSSLHALATLASWR